MNRIGSFFIVSLLGIGVATVVACSSDSDDSGTPTTPANDAGPIADTAPVDTGVVDTGAGEVDSGSPDAEVDAGPCLQIGGVYALTNGTCTSTAFSAPTLLCIRQTGCNLTGTDDFLGQALTGSTTATTVTATVNSPVHQDCTTTVANGAVTGLTCGASGVTCSTTPAKVTLSPDVTDLCCDTTSQDCASGQRCTVLGTSNENLALPNGCLPDNGTVDLDGTCTRKSTDAVDIGNDNCKKGLFCANVGQANSTTRTCRKLCKDNSECTVSGTACFSFQAALAGLCQPRCSIFDPDVPACGEGNTCRVTQSLSGGKFVHDQVCSFTGTGATGSTCAASADCGAGLACAAGKCAAYCDSNHACKTGTCTVFTGTSVTGFDATLGTCQ